MRIYLTEGFGGERVRIRVNGRTVFDRPEVRTNYSSGLAAIGEAEVAEQVAVEVELPDRRLRAEYVAAPREGLALLVRMGPQGPEFEEASEPVHFL